MDDRVKYFFDSFNYFYSFFYKLFDFFFENYPLLFSKVVKDDKEALTIDQNQLRMLFKKKYKLEHCIEALCETNNVYVKAIGNSIL